eukprot:scaffold2357_cov167-Amphora_coffeaeformis.AAC.2
MVFVAGVRIGLFTILGQDFDIQLFGPPILVRRAIARMQKGAFCSAVGAATHDGNEIEGILTPTSVRLPCSRNATNAAYPGQRRQSTSPQAPRQHHTMLW